MAVEVIMPQMGESIFEGTVTKWLKKPGDKIERDEPLFEISTDKVDAEIPAPVAGVLKEIKVNEGQTVPVQTVVALIETAESAVAASQASTEKTEAAAIPAKMPSVAPTPTPAKQDDDAVRSSPLVRRLAEEHNIDLATVRGTGTGGRITKADVEGAIAQGRQHSPAASDTASGTATSSPQAARETSIPRERIYFGRHEVQPMTVMRQRIAEHMVLSKRVSPHVYSIEEVDMTHVTHLQAAASDEFEKRHQTRLTLMGLPIINQPNVAILAIGAIQKRPVVVDDAIAIRAMAYLTLSYDHRAVDGAIGLQFMRTVKRHLEDWNEEIL